MTRKIKTPTPPSAYDERELENVVDNAPEYATIRGRRFGFRGLTGHGRHKISRVMLKEDSDEFAVSCKVLAAARLNGYFSIKFLWWALWRWYYYVRAYTESELLGALAVIKKKVAAEDYWAATMLQIGMRETVMQMNREEVAASLRELSTAKAGKSAKNAPGSPSR